MYPLRKTILLVSAALIPPVILIACSNRAANQGKAAQPAIAANEFVGNEACVECHAAEFKAHKASRHAQTLRFATKAALGSQTPAAGAIPNSSYEVTVDDVAGLEFGVTGQSSHPLQLAFGSGKSGIAFAVALSGDSLAEAHMSYLPGIKKWFVTPGQQAIQDGQLGNIMQGESARKCVSCHVVTLPPGSLTPEPKFMGVGCESCHGAGGTHAAAMRAGKRSEMEQLGKAGGLRINEVCGKCHRTEREVADKKLAKENTDLFQAHGLAQSRCFKESGDRLTCNTCHDAHGDASQKEATYVKACLSCHSGAASAAAPQPPILGELSSSPKACPVNRTDRCTGCHMPRRPEPLYEGSPRSVADHFIRVYDRPVRANREESTGL